jgi:hypothetical protein
VNGLEEGPGVKTWLNGQRYVGEWRSGKRNGFGTLFYAKDNVNRVLLYSGHFVDDIRSGNGTLEWQDGTFYRGEFRGGNRHGHGLQTYIDGTYEGQWVNDEKNGLGRLDFNYDDEIKSLAYIGNFENDVRTGNGTYYWQNRDTYTGGHKNALREGYGVYHFANGQRYEGQWKNNKRNGQGTLFSSNGTVISRGQWRDSEFITL